MNDQHITRRDVLALVLYATLAFGVLIWFSYLLDQIVLPQISLFKTPYPLARGGWLQLAINLTCALALLPFVPLAATSAAGRKAQHPVTKSAFWSLLLPCVGLLLFVTAIPQGVSFAYEYWQAKSGAFPLSSRISPFYLQNIASALIRLSVGFALAFFPAIFDSFRHPDERGAV